MSQAEIVAGKFHMIKQVNIQLDDLRETFRAEAEDPKNVS